MSNATTYSDPRFGVEKILVFPSINFNQPVGSKAIFALTNDIVLSEIGYVITTAISGPGATVVYSVGPSGASTGIFYTGSLASGAAIGASTAITSGFSTTYMYSGQKLELATTTSCIGAGAINVYVKFKEVYSV